MTERACIVCPQLRTNAEPRVYDRPHVCAGCRSRLRSLLAEVLDCYAQVDDKTLINAGTWKDEHGADHLDPIAAVLPAGLTAGQNRESVVSGSRENNPVRVDALDLTMPPPLRHVHDDNGDQTGHPGTAAVLDSWARDWQTYRPTWEHLPLPTVSSLVGWLTDRLDWACDEHPAIDDFADELRAMTAVLRSAAGMNRPKAELKLGVPCRECETVALFRWPGSPYIECGACSLLLTDEEYERWTQLLAAPEHQPWVRSIAEKGTAA